MGRMFWFRRFGATDRMSRGGSLFDETRAEADLALDFGKVSVLVVPGSRASTTTRKVFEDGFDAVFARSSELLFGLADSELCAPGVDLSLVVVDGACVAGARIYPQKDGVGVVVGSLWADPQHQGRGYARLAAASLLANASTDVDDKLCASCEIRVLPNGTLNEASAAVFAKLGFEHGDITEREILGTPVDRHLFASAQPGGKSYRALTMHARLGIARERALAVLGSALINSSVQERAA